MDSLCWFYCNSRLNATWVLFFGHSVDFSRDNFCNFRELYLVKREEEVKLRYQSKGKEKKDKNKVKFIINDTGPDEFKISGGDGSGSVRPGSGWNHYKR